MGNTDTMCLVEAGCVCTKITITPAVLRVNFFKMLCITAVILSGQLLNLTSKQKLIINHTSKTNYGYVMMQQSILLAQLHHCMDQWTQSLQLFCLPYPGGKYFMHHLVSFCQIFNCNFFKNFIPYFSLSVSFPNTTGKITRIHKL